MAETDDLAGQGERFAAPPAEFLHPRGYVCPRGTPEVDGDLNDPAWVAAPWTDDFLDIQGVHMPAPRHRTRVKMLWDDEFFYIAAELEEPHLWATLTEHDSVIFQDNDFEVFIDPDADTHEYYEYEINALGTDWDLRLTKPYRNGGEALNEWEIPGLQKGVKLYGTLNDPSDTDEKWTIELGIPWTVLQEFSKVPSPPRIGDRWRVNFSRVHWDLDVVDGGYRKIPDRPEHNWVWSPQGAIDMHRPEKWGYVEFAESAGEFSPDRLARAQHDLMRSFFQNLRSGTWGAAQMDGMEHRIACEGDVISTRVPGGRLCVRQDSLTWFEKQ